MSEQLSNEGFARIRTGGEEYEATQENTTVYTHLGKLALYDHIYVKVEDKKSVYIWSYSGNFPEIKDKALENNCQAFLNLREVDGRDIETYVKHATSDLTDMPPSWEMEDE